MNYIAEIKRFYDRQLSEHLSAGQVALWHAIIEIANRSGWQEWFYTPMSTLVILSGSTPPTIHKNLEILCKKNYIKFNKNYIKILTQNYSTSEKHLIINNKTKLNETKRKENSENGNDKFCRQDPLSLPGGIKL